MKKRKRKTQRKFCDSAGMDYGWLIVEPTPTDEDGLWVVINGVKNFESGETGLWLSPKDAEAMGKQLLRVAAKAKKMKPKNWGCEICPAGPW